jgi:hypothetical protein
MQRDLRFSLTIETNALLCPNPQEFYSRSYIDEQIVDNFRVLPGIKAATKLANVTFGQVTKASTCNFTAPTEALDAIDIDVTPTSIMAQICQFDVEQSFLALQMAKGSNGDFTVQSFMNYYWAELANKAREERSLRRWQGDTTSLDANLALVDGHLKKLKADTAVIDVDNGGVASTTANVIAAMTSVYQAMPAEVRAKVADLRWFVSSDIAGNYKLATASQNTVNNVTAQLGLTFLGIKIIEDAALPTNTMVFTLKDNLIYAFDGEKDGEELKAVNLSDTVAEPYIRTRANQKEGYHHVNGGEIVFYWNAP